MDSMRKDLIAFLENDNRITTAQGIYLIRHSDSCTFEALGELSIEDIVAADEKVKASRLYGEMFEVVEDTLIQLCDIKVRYEQGALGLPSYIVQMYDRMEHLILRIKDMKGGK